MAEPAHFLIRPSQKETPRLRPEDHMGLINALKSLTPLAEIHVVTLRGMSKSRQMELFSRAWVCLSLYSPRREIIGLI